MITSIEAKRRQQQIIKELNNAKYCIWIADAWFQDKEIYNILINKTIEGLSVEIILTEDDPAKHDNDTDFKDFTRAGGEVYYIGSKDSREFKYREFCIIDFKTIILGACKNGPDTNINGKNIIIYKNFESISTLVTREYLAIKNCCERSKYLA